MTTIETPRAYVACLASYNAGRLFGEWIDLSGDADEIRESIAGVLAKSPHQGAEEWAFHDFENLGGWSPGENPDLDELARVVELAEEHGPAVFGYAGNGNDVEGFEDAYRGEWESLADYAEELFADCYSDSLKDLPDLIRHNIDWKAIGEDLRIGGDVFTVDAPGGMVWVFDNHV